MFIKFKKISGIGLGIFTLILVVWGIYIPFSSASDVTVTSVQVTVCGDGATEGAEECDDGKHCTNGASCTTDADCTGIGDELCLPRSGDGCSSDCETEEGGGAQPPQYVYISQITAYPEQRSGPLGTNYDTTYTFSILNPDNQNHQVLYQYPDLLTSTNSGVSSVYIVPPFTITEGTYDIALKSKAHLSRVLDNVYLQIGENLLNFTNEANLPQIGSVRLIAGDINDLATSPDTLGDDVINAVDLSILLHEYGNSDSTGNSIRANLNQDPVVDELDLNILLNNLDKEGDI